MTPPLQAQLLFDSWHPRTWHHGALPELVCNIWKQGMRATARWQCGLSGFQGHRWRVVGLPSSHHWQLRCGLEHTRLERPLKRVASLFAAVTIQTPCSVRSHKHFYTPSRLCPHSLYHTNNNCTVKFCVHVQYCKVSVPSVSGVHRCMAC